MIDYYTLPDGRSGLAPSEGKIVLPETDTDPWHSAATPDDLPPKLRAEYDALPVEVVPSRDALRLSINAERDRRAAQPLNAAMPDNTVFAVDADPASVQNLFGALLVMQLPGGPAAITWRGSANDDRNLDATDVATIVGQGAYRKDALHAFGRALKDSLAGMSDAQLAALDPANDAHWIAPAA